MPRCRVGLPKPPAGPSLASTTIFRAAKQTRRTLPTGPIMKSDGRLPVAIVGGGFSGTILAAQLARRGVSSVLIDGSGRMGRGVAYSTREPAHLLNVRAEGMSAWAGEPDHFARLFEAEGGDRRGVAERRLFGRYLGAILDKAEGSGKTRTVDAVAGGAARCGNGWQVGLDNGERTDADALAIALRNQDPAARSAFTGVGD